MRRATIVIEVFDETNVEGLKELFTRRHRILSFLPKHLRRRAQAQLIKAQSRGTVAIWTVYAGNGRPIASSAELFADEAAAMSNAATVMAHVDELSVLRVHSTVASAFAWYMCVEGHARVISCRHFSTRRLCERNAATVLTALRVGSIVPHRGSGFLEKDPRLQPGIDEKVLARMTEPLNVRGAERAIRPIVRSYTQALPVGSGALRGGRVSRDSTTVGGGGS